MERSLLPIKASEPEPPHTQVRQVDSTLRAAAQNTLPRPSPAVVFRPVSDGAVLLDMEHEIYFGLNAVGSQVWQALPPTCGDLDEICARLGRSYPEVEPAQLRADIVDLLAQLLEHALVADAA